MCSPDQQPCTVTVALLPRPGTVTLWEAGDLPRAGELVFSWSIITCRAATLREGQRRPLHQLAWSQALLAGELEAENLSFPVQLSDAGSLHCSCGVWSVKETPTVSCEVEARVLLGARFYQ